MLRNMVRSNQWTLVHQRDETLRRRSSRAPDWTWGQPQGARITPSMGLSSDNDVEAAYVAEGNVAVA
jgi:hypothetical protein